MLVLFGTKCIWKKKIILSKTKVVCNTKHAFALRLRFLMLIMILKCICSNFPKNLLIICPHPPLTPPLTAEPYCFHSASGQRSRLSGKHGDRYLITILVVLGKFTEKFQILSLELKVKFIWIAFVCISDGFRPTCLIYIGYASCWQVPQNGGQTWRLPKIR